MAGPKSNRAELNKTLYYICSLLLENLPENSWFIGYGTLLGMVRNNSCIEGDDDIDIIVDIKQRKVLRDILTSEGLKLWYDKPNLLKTHPTEEYVTMDFYMSNVKEVVKNEEMCSVTTNFNDTWEKCVWSNVYPLERKEWKDIIINMPKDSRVKLERRYGDDWETPVSGKKAPTGKARTRVV